MNIAKGYGSSIGDTVLCLEGAACCISLALHYKHYFRMPTVKLKIFYFLYLTVWTFGMALLFLWLFVYVAIGLFTIAFIWILTQKAPPAPCSSSNNDGVIELSDGSKVRQSMSNPKVYNDIHSSKKFVRNGNDFLEM